MGGQVFLPGWADPVLARWLGSVPRRTWNPLFFRFPLVILSSQSASGLTKSQPHASFPNQSSATERSSKQPLQRPSSSCHEHHICWLADTPGPLQPAGSVPDKGHRQLAAWRGSHGIHAAIENRRLHAAKEPLRLVQHPQGSLRLWWPCLTSGWLLRHAPSTSDTSGPRSA
ncbi:hypothetical protein BKA81DRAFT_346508 [Phyllosticta paracitricarpa]|uniref:Uncharacterized protein n=1 Tax=Phyllosticta citricarpa TaxID=55181 RepID=A0ABR1ML36_9PEZI